MGPDDLERKCKTGDVVAEGDILVIAATPAARPKLRDLAGTNTELAPDRSSIKAKVYGCVKADGPRVDVLPPVVIASDALTATMDLAAVTATGREVTSKMILRALVAAEVKFGADERRIQEGLAKARASGRVLAAVPVAFGVAAVAGQEAGYELLFQARGHDAADAAPRSVGPRSVGPGSAEALDLVREGDLLCRGVPRVVAKQGRNVRGAVLDPGRPRAMNHLKLKCGLNVRHEADGDAYFSAAPVCGYAELLKDGTLQVTSPIVVSDDAMSVRLTVHPPRDDGRMLEEQDIARLLQLKKVVAGIDAPAVRRVIAVASETRRAQPGVLIASGVAPVHGQDARIEVLSASEKRAGDEQGDGSIDFHERSGIAAVRAGAPIGKRVPATVGRAGRDVLGRVVPATAGRDVAFEPGNNVVMTPDGSGFLATASGVVLVARDVISVNPALQISGDIDFGTGNIRATESAIQVAGTVRSGFTVQAATLMVQGSVEDCKIDIIGDVSIRAGVLHGDGGYIKAGGSVVAAFAQNARITAGETVTIYNSALNCELCGRKVVLGGGKGCLVGGVTTGQEVVDVKELGSRAGVATVVRIEPVTDELVEINAQIGQLTAVIAKANALIGEGPSAAHAKPVAPGQRAVIEAQRRARDEARAALLPLSHRRLGLLDAARAGSKGDVFIRGAVFPGVMVSIHGVVHTFTLEQSRCRLRLDDAREKIVVTPMR